MSTADPRESRIASLLADSYEMLGHLGRGGFATVYRVRNKRLDRVEALKVLSADLEDPDFAGRFRQEARVAASLDHPNIVKIYAYGQAADDLCWFTMQFVEGPTLNRQLKQNGPWSETDTATLAASICDALDYSHRRGIVHRDIKPENILVDADRHPYLMDFGIAKSEQSIVHTRTGTVLGSPAYIAPEQLTAGIIDGRADIYSLGATLYRMVSNRFPFEDSDPVRMAMKRFSMPPEPLGGKRPGIDPIFDQIVMRALEREPAARFQTAAEMGRTLREFLAGSSASLPARPLPGRAGEDPERTTPRVISVPLPSAGPAAVSTTAAAPVDSDALPTIRTPVPAAVPEPPSPPQILRGRSTRVKTWPVAGVLALLLVAAAALLLRGGRTSSAPGQPPATAVPSPAPHSRPEPAAASSPPSVAASDLPTPAPTVVLAQKRPSETFPKIQATSPPPRGARREEEPAAPAPPRRAVVAAQTESEPAIEIAPDVAREFANRVVGIAVLIGEDGTVREARVISPLCAECDRAALAAIRRYRFKPARDARGSPVESRQAVSVIIPAPESP